MIPFMIIRVVLIEDQRETLNSLSILLNNTDTLDVIDTFTSGEEAIEGIPELNPDVALIDLGLPGISGIEVIKKLKELLPTLEMLVLTVYEDKRHLFSALKAGASGYLLKDSTPEEIIEAIEETHSGGAPMSPRIARYVIEFFHKSESGGEAGTSILTEREKEILNGIADGLTDRKLGERLFISPHTVRTHIKNIYDKLHVHSKIEAVMKAKEVGML
jgi:two-component system NarL family response regulator